METTEHVTIQAAISVGDAGTPYSVSIDVEYQRYETSILVIDWMENDSPYDNPPELWYKQVKEKIDDYFYDTYPKLKVAFKY